MCFAVGNTLSNNWCWLSENILLWTLRFRYLDNPITFVDIIVKKQCLEFSEEIQSAIVNCAGKIVSKLLNKVFAKDIAVEEVFLLFDVPT